MDFFVGGGWWIRTTEVSDNRFTVCPLWPLGKSPIWSWWTESNHQPADYKSAALPLSHTSILLTDFCRNDAYYTIGYLFCQYVFEKIFQMIFIFSYVKIFSLSNVEQRLFFCIEWKWNPILSYLKEWYCDENCCLEVSGDTCSAA